MPEQHLADPAHSTNAPQERHYGVSSTVSQIADPAWSRYGPIDGHRVDADHSARLTVDKLTVDKLTVDNESLGSISIKQGN
jgi:hypothetical protein